MSPSENTTRLSAVLGDYPHTRPLKTGDVRSDDLTLDFVEVTPTNHAFKPMVREQRFDVSEMAVVTYLQAKSHGKPLLLVPAVMLGRLPHSMFVYDPRKGEVAPGDLAGRRIGIRSSTTTTGVWVRGILAEDYGVNLDRVQWVTFEEPHVAEYRDPSARAPEGRAILDMLFAGELDAVIGEKSSDPRLRPVFPDPDAAGRAWHGRHGFLPINHMVVVRTDLAAANPGLLAGLYDLLTRAKAAGAPRTEGDIDWAPFGIEANRAALQTIIRFSLEQGLIPRPFTVDELFEDWIRFGGPAA